MAMFLNRLVSWAFGSSNKSCAVITPPAACGPAAEEEERYSVAFKEKVYTVHLPLSLSRRQVLC